MGVQRLEWVFANTVVASSSTSQQLELVFSPVGEFLHGREYVCRAITASGTLENTISLSVESKYMDTNVVYKNGMELCTLFIYLFFFFLQFLLMLLH